MDKQKEVSINRKTDIKQIIFLILLIIAIASLISAIITIKKYSNMLKNPVGYNLEQFGIKYCSCYDEKGAIIPIEAISYNSTFDKYKPKPEYISSEDIEPIIFNKNVTK